MRCAAGTGGRPNYAAHFNRPDCGVFHHSNFIIVANLAADG